jgi:hypothetical protein
MLVQEFAMQACAEFAMQAYLVCAEFRLIRLVQEFAICAGINKI